MSDDDENITTAYVREWLSDAEAERDALAARVEELEARIARALTALDAPVPSSASSYARRILRGEDDTSSTERTE